MALDLNKLSEKVRIALENETPESLEAWLNRQQPAPSSESEDEITMWNEVYRELLSHKLQGSYCLEIIERIQNAFTNSKLTITRKGENEAVDWQVLFNEFQIWYGDIKKSETEDVFINRLSKAFHLQLISKDHLSKTSELLALQKQQSNG